MEAQTTNAAIGANAPLSSAVFDELDCFVVNLPDAQKRMADFLAANSDCGIKFQRFNAINGKSISIDQAIAIGVVKAGTTHYTPGAIGAALSHRSLWRRCVESGRPILVFEDDVVIRKDFPETFDRLLHNRPFDIVLFGYNTDSFLDVQLVAGIDLVAGFSVHYPTLDQLATFSLQTPPTVLLRLNQAFGTCAYAITPQGASRLLEACFPMDARLVEMPNIRKRVRAFSIDSIANGVYRHMHAYACVPPLALPFNDPRTSTTRPDALRTAPLT